MITTSAEYQEKIKASRRTILGKVSIQYSDPFLDPSVAVSVNESAYISQPLQSADVNDEATHKWVSLDGSWVLDGSYYLCPDTTKDAKVNQMGWWGSTLSGQDCKFSAPYPTLTTTFSSRPLRYIAVCGDTKRQEYPKEFDVLIYSGSTLIYTKSITDNKEIRTLIDLSSLNLKNITKLVLQIKKWSHPKRQVKIMEFFATIEEVYAGDDIFGISLLEEREFSTGTLPIGNISANELDVKINNVDRRFDAGNAESNLYGLIKPNRRIKAWLGVEKTSETEWIPLGVFWSGEWTVPEDDIYAETSARDRLDLLTRSTFAGPVFQNISMYDLAKMVLDDTGYPYWIDEDLKKYIIPWAYFEDITHRECLRIIAEASLSQVYADRTGTIRVEGPDYLKSNSAASVKTLTTDDYFHKDNPANYTDLANYIEVNTQPLTPVSVSEEVYKSDTGVSISVGETQSFVIAYSKKPVIGASASLEGVPIEGTNPEQVTPIPAGLTIKSITYYAWGADVEISGATVAGQYILVVDGRPLEVQGSRKVYARDAQSIRENGKLDYIFADNPLIQTVQMAQLIVNKCLALSKDPRRDLDLTWRGDPTLKLGDRITVPDSKTTNADFYIVSSSLEFDGGLKATIKGKKVVG